MKRNIRLALAIGSVVTLVGAFLPVEAGARGGDRGSYRTSRSSSHHSSARARSHSSGRFNTDRSHRGSHASGRYRVHRHSPSRSVRRHHGDRGRYRVYRYPRHHYRHHGHYSYPYSYRHYYPYYYSYPYYYDVGFYFWPWPYFWGSYYSSAPRYVYGPSYGYGEPDEDYAPDDGDWRGWSEERPAPTEEESGREAVGVELGGWSQTGWIFFSVDEPNARVYLNGSLVGEAGQLDERSEGLSVRSGLHRIEIVSEDGSSRSYLLRVAPGEQKLVHHSFSAPQKAPSPQPSGSSDARSSAPRRDGPAI